MELHIQNHRALPGRLRWRIGAVITDVRPADIMPDAFAIRLAAQTVRRAATARPFQFRHLQQMRQTSDPHAHALQNLPCPALARGRCQGVFHGAEIDRRDGFIHFSSAAQAQETAAKDFAGQDDLSLIAVDGARLGAALKWEPSRGGALFPHLYGALDLAAVTRVDPLPLGSDGRAPRFPPLAELIPTAANLRTSPSPSREKSFVVIPDVAKRRSGIQETRMKSVSLDSGFASEFAIGPASAGLAPE